MIKIAVCLVFAGGLAAAQQLPTPKCGPGTVPGPHGTCVKQTPKTKTIDIDGGLHIDGKLRSLSMLGFIERVNEELQSTTLESKSFVPRLVRSVDEAAL